MFTVEGKINGFQVVSLSCRRVTAKRNPIFNKVNNNNNETNNNKTWNPTSVILWRRYLFLQVAPAEDI